MAGVRLCGQEYRRTQGVFAVLEWPMAATLKLEFRFAARVTRCATAREFSSRQLRGSSRGGGFLSCRVGVKLHAASNGAFFGSSLHETNKTEHVRGRLQLSGAIWYMYHQPHLKFLETNICSFGTKSHKETSRRLLFWAVVRPNIQAQELDFFCVFFCLQCWPQCTTWHQRKTEKLTNLPPPKKNPSKTTTTTTTKEKIIKTPEKDIRILLGFQGFFFQGADASCTPPRMISA